MDRRTTQDRIVGTMRKIVENKRLQVDDETSANSGRSGPRIKNFKEWLRTRVSFHNYINNRYTR